MLIHGLDKLINLGEILIPKVQTHQASTYVCNVEELAVGIANSKSLQVPCISKG